MDEKDPLKELEGDPDWEKWRNEQVQTISNILSNVFKVEDEAHQTRAPSRLLRNPAKEPEEVFEKLNSIREQISEYEQMLQLGRKRIDKVLEVIQPTPAQPQKIEETSKPISRIHGLRKWVRRKIVKRFIRKKP